MMLWTPIQWILSLDIIVQIVIALHEQTFVAWLRPVLMFGLLTTLICVIAFVKHPWVREDDERIARERQRVLS
jgi:hypothetical protein